MSQNVNSDDGYDYFGDDHVGSVLVRQWCAAGCYRYIDGDVYDGDGGDGPD